MAESWTVLPYESPGGGQKIPYRRVPDCSLLGRRVLKE
jgi:hypothetical protein